MRMKFFTYFEGIFCTGWKENTLLTFSFVWKYYKEMNMPKTNSNPTSTRVNYITTKWTRRKNVPQGLNFVDRKRMVKRKHIIHHTFVLVEVVIYWKLNSHIIGRSRVRTSSYIYISKFTWKWYKSYSMIHWQIYCDSLSTKNFGT
jgi:hypothetical protein